MSEKPYETDESPEEQELIKRAHEVVIQYLNHMLRNSREGRRQLEHLLGQSIESEQEFQSKDLVYVPTWAIETPMNRIPDSQNNPNERTFVFKITSSPKNNVFCAITVKKEENGECSFDSDTFISFPQPDLPEA